MDLRALRYFVFIAEEGSVHAGARRAMVAQPALSVALKKLEREIGAALFERSPRGVTLTPAGHNLLPHARYLLKYAENARTEAQLSRREAVPTFTVGLIAGRMAAAELTGPILDTFQRANPGVCVRVRELNFADQFDSVLDGIVDVAIIRSPFEHPALAMKPLFSEPTVLVASSDHRLARVPEVSIQTVLDERLLEVVRAPQVWRGFWNLSELRDDGSRKIPTTAVGVLDYTMDVLRNSAVGLMAQSAWRLGGLGVGDQTSRLIRVIDAPRTVVGVGYLSGSQDPLINAFVATASAVAEQFVSLVPDGVLTSGS